MQSAGETRKAEQCRQQSVQDAPFWGEPEVCTPADLSVPPEPAAPQPPETCATTDPVSGQYVSTQNFSAAQLTSSRTWTPSQSAFFGGMVPPQTTAAAPAADDLQPAFDSVMNAVLRDLDQTPPPKTAIEAMQSVLPPHNPGISGGAVKASFDLVGPAADGSEYYAQYADGQFELAKLYQKLDRPAEELAKMSPSELAEMRQELEAYRRTVDAIHAEGTDYGYSATHALEYLENRAYAEMGRGSAEAIEVTGFNFGINMTDLNKRDPSGKLGDIVRDYVRRKANEVFGRQYGHRDSAKELDVRAGRAQDIAADNVSQLKNMTFLALDVTEAEANAGLTRIQAETEAYLRSQEFQSRMAAALGREQAELVLKKGLSGVHLQMAGYYGKGAIGRGELRPGELQTAAVKLLARFHLGEDVASAKLKGQPKATSIVVTGALGETPAKETAAINRAARSIFSLFKAPAPEMAPGAQFAAEIDPKTAEEELRITEQDLRDGFVLRRSHSFGMGFAHARELQLLLDRVEKAVEAYQAEPTTGNLAEVNAARQEMASYLREPPARIDPTRTPVMERMAQDFAHSRRVYRFRTADGEGFVAFKRSHIGAVVEERSEGYKGRQWAVSLELGKVGDYMKQYAAADGVQDPVFANLLEHVTEGLAKRGFDVEMAVMGGDEFALHVREAPGQKKTDAELQQALAEVGGEFRQLHAKRRYAYSEKAPLPGGRWNGVQFGVDAQGKLHFKQPEGMDTAAFRRQVLSTVADEGFRRTVQENFGVELSSAAEGRGYVIQSEGDFNTSNGGVGRRDVWQVKDGNGNVQELYLNPGGEAKGRDAVRPERTLTMESAAAPVADARDFAETVNTVLPEGIKQNKKNGTDVAMMEGLTLSQRLEHRTGRRITANAAQFGFASIGSKLIVNGIRMFAGGDSSVLTENIDVGDTALQFAAMSGGAVLGEYLGRTLMTASTGRFFETGKFNLEAVNTRYVGWRGRTIGGMGTVGAVALAELVETGRVDPVNLLNSIALIKGAQYIRQGLQMAMGGKHGGGGKGGGWAMLVEFLLMEGLTFVEAQAILGYEIDSRRMKLAERMREYDAAIVAVGEQGPDEGRLELVARRRGQVQQAYRDCADIERFSLADEYGKANRLMEREAKSREAYDKVKDADADEIRSLAFTEPELRDTFGMMILRPEKDMVSDVRQMQRTRMEEAQSAFLRALDDAASEFARAERERGRELVKRGGVERLHIPFADEHEKFVKSREQQYKAERAASFAPPENIEMRYAERRERMLPEGKAVEDWEKRYEGSFVYDSHEFDLQMRAFLRERELRLQAYARRRGGE